MLRDDLNTALALLEWDFPISVLDITTHLLHHVVDGIERFGPVYSTWMYPYERFNSWLSRRALNQFRSEATIMETYWIFEWCEFMKLANPDCCSKVTRSIKIPRNG
ncbi:uncharacterized protein [Dysidea avara]|uniref:uncharacterized protein n=1 Tax=Dysidea avara TaxID=196820 RepID=UPI0033245197